MNTLETKLLADCKDQITRLAKLWHEAIGKPWIPNSNPSKAEQTYQEHLHRDSLPLTYVSLIQHEAVAMCSLRVDDGLGTANTPWLGSLVVDVAHRNQGIGKHLIDVIKSQAQTMGFKKLYLLALDPEIPHWYERLGWKIIGNDQLYHHPVVVMETML